MKNVVGESDVELLARVAAADRSAFELLYRRHYTKVFQFVFRMLRQRETAEEVVDDTFFAVWRGADAFEGRSAFSTWLLGIGHRQALKAIERNRRPLEVTCEDEQMNAFADGAADTDPQANAAAAQMRSHLHQSIEALSQSHRSVIELAALGHSAREIADIVECPEATVRTRMFHARLQLKKCLARVEAPTPHALGSRSHG